jgi:hypothetical protein
METSTRTALAVVLTGSILGFSPPAEPVAAVASGWSERYQPTKLEWLALRLEANLGGTSAEPPGLTFRASKDELSIVMITRESPQVAGEVAKHLQMAFLEIQEVAHDLGLPPPRVTVSMSKLKFRGPEDHRSLTCRVPALGPNGEREGRFDLKTMCR